MLTLKSYAGIGARNTPTDILNLMTLFSEAMVDRPLHLRTGAAVGADQAFIRGIIHKKRANTNTLSIFLPWKSFEQSFLYKYDIMHLISEHPSEAAISVASRYHSNWDTCGNAIKLLHGRNSEIILGKDLNSPVRAVICWTKGGQAIGGTGLALRIAKSKNIPIFNIGKFNNSNDIITNLRLFAKKISSINK